VADKPITTLDSYRLLGRSGIRVSPICLGCMTFGEQWGFGANSEDSRKVYDLYRAKGGNFFDTANLYTNGDSERFLGEYIQSHRSEVVVATKFSGNDDAMRAAAGALKGRANPNAGGNGLKNLAQTVDGSLKRLGVSAIDLFYLHFWDNSTPVEQIVRGLDDVVRSGKAHSVAISDAPAWVIARANTIAEFRGWSPFVALQTRYSLVERSFEGDLHDLTTAFGLATVPWGILAEGFLTGKHAKENLGATGRQNALQGTVGEDKNWAILEEVKQVAKEVGKTPAQVSINWLLKKGITSPLVGAKNEAQLQDNLGALDFTLTEEQFQRLNTVSAPNLAFPFSFLHRARLFADANTTVDRTRSYLL